MNGSVRRLSAALVTAWALAGAYVLGQQTSAPPPAPQTPPPPQQQPVFRAGVNLITVDAYPQRNGKIVPDLKAEDFEVYEDGKLQKVESFSFIRIEPGPVDTSLKDPNTVTESLKLAADPANRVFVLYLDMYHVTVAGSHDIRQPLANMFGDLLAPNDLFGIMTPLLRPQDLALGRVSLGVEEQLMKYWPWGQRDNSIKKDPNDLFLESCFVNRPDNGQPWIVNDGAAQRNLADVMIARRREDATIASVESLISYLGAIRESRKSILLITPGWILYQRDDAIFGQITTLPFASSSVFAPCMQAAQNLLSIDDQQRMRELIDRANRNNVTFYPVSPQGLQVFDTPINESLGVNLGPTAPIGGSVALTELDRSRARSSSDRTLAENTDGIAVVDTNDLRTGLKRVMDDMSAYYLLGYYSTNGKPDGKFHKIQVKTKQPGVTMKARRGYVAPSAIEAAAGAAMASKPAAGPSPVDTALGSLARLDKAPEVLVYGVASATDLSVIVELASAMVGRAAWAESAVQATITDAAGATVATLKGKIDAGSRGLTLTTPLGFGAGPWRVFVHVDGRDDSREERLTVAPPAGVVLGDMTVFRGTPAATSALRPVADFEFRRNERVHIEWPIVSALDQRTARLLDRRGQPLALDVTLTERPATSGSVLAADVNLGPLAPADYVIEVTAGHGTDTERKLVAFRVIQ